MGRQNDAIRALLASAMLMIIVNPEWAVELSFQLSFLVTLGLIVVFPLLDRLIPGKGMFLREDLLTTLAAQVLVWPLIAYAFGQVSLLSPVVNTFVLWTTPIITYLSLVTTIMGLLIKDVIILIMVPVRFFLDYFIWIVKLFSSWSVGYFEISAFSALALVFYFIVLGAGIWFLHQISVKRAKTA